MSGKGKGKRTNSQKIIKNMDTSSDNETKEETKKEIYEENNDLNYEVSGEIIKDGNINIVDELAKFLDTDSPYTLCGFFDVNDTYAFKEYEHGLMLKFYICVVQVDTKRAILNSFLKQSEHYDKIQYVGINVFINKTRKNLIESLKKQTNEKEFYNIDGCKIVENKNKNFGEYTLRLGYKYIELKEKEKLIRIINKDDKISKILKNKYYSKPTRPTEKAIKLMDKIELLGEDE